ncbi:hypothetical protein ACHAWF_010656 [Thalassiosira exigua]
MTFAVAAKATSAMGGIISHNTAARNGRWLAYKLISDGGRYTDGWFLCHEDVDPVYELRQMIYNTFPKDQNGGNDAVEFHKQMVSLPHHISFKIISISRYFMGFEHNITDGRNVKKEMKMGLCVVDYEALKKKGEKALKKNAIRGMVTYGDYDIGRLTYGDEGLCKAFLLTGTAVQFDKTYFVGGTAPLGRDNGQEWCECGGLEPDCVQPIKGQTKLTSFFSRASS